MGQCRHAEMIETKMMKTGAGKTGMELDGNTKGGDEEEVYKRKREIHAYNYLASFHIHTYTHIPISDVFLTP